MDPIKDAFAKVRQDMDSLRNEILFLQQQLSDLRQTLSYQAEIFPPPYQTQSPQNQTDQQINQTDKLTEPYQQAQYGLKSPNIAFSTGNEGVQTDRQTDSLTASQTDRHIQHTGKSDEIGRLARAAEVLNSLDELRKEVRVKFKRLTDQEMAVFSAIYTLDELHQQPDYHFLSKHLKLSESSIRDYVRKIINKGIPVEKSKENNKKIALSISPDLKRVATLPTIMQLREL